MAQPLQLTVPDRACNKATPHSITALEHRKQTKGTDQLTGSTAGPISTTKNTLLVSSCCLHAEVRVLHMIVILTGDSAVTGRTMSDAPSLSTRVQRQKIQQNIMSTCGRRTGGNAVKILLGVRNKQRKSLRVCRTALVLGRWML